MGFAVLHIEKGTAGKAGGLGSHIDRTKKVLNADPKLSEKNLFYHLGENGKVYVYDNFKNRRSLQERINRRIQEGYKGKTAIRKDAVTHLNVVLTGSHEEMTAIGENPERLTQWMNENYRFVSERFGGRNVVDFTLHMDERTPHIHCVVVPLTKDGRLSAKEVMGDRRKLSELQDCYGKAMQNKFGLQRGIKGSTATHDSVREYYGRIEERLIYPSNSMELNYETRAPQIGTPPLIGREKWAEKQNKAIYEDFTQMREHYKHEAEKQSQKVLKYFQNSKLQAEEKADRLRKENAQLRGVIEEQHKKLHPERYIRHNKGYSL